MTISLPASSGTTSTRGRRDALPTGPSVSHARYSRPSPDRVSQASWMIRSSDRTSSTSRPSEASSAGTRSQSASAGAGTAVLATSLPAQRSSIRTPHPLVPRGRAPRIPCRRVLRIPHPSFEPCPAAHGGRRNRSSTAVVPRPDHVRQSTFHAPRGANRRCGMKSSGLRAQRGEVPPCHPHARGRACERYGPLGAPSIPAARERPRSNASGRAGAPLGRQGRAVGDVSPR